MFSKSILEFFNVDFMSLMYLVKFLFRGSVNSEYGKRLRWDLETGMNKVSKNKIYSRNELLNDHVSLIENKDTTSTDLLQEYIENNF